MKQVLIIASFWPYRQGSKRTIGLAKYLPERGWQPIILTPPLPSKPAPPFRVIETPYRSALGFWGGLLRLDPDADIRSQFKKRLGVTAQKSKLDSLLTLGGAIVNYPDAYKGWSPFAVKAADQLLRSEPINAIISIWPVTSHLIAKDLKTKNGIPWIADFPDLWSQNAYYVYGSLRKWLDRRLELKTLANADALTTTSEPWAEKLKMLHGERAIFSITHGFDPAVMVMSPVKLTTRFTITYTGMIYAGKRDPTKLLRAIRELVSSGAIKPDDVEIRFYGPPEEWLTKAIEEYHLSDVVKQYGVIPHQAALEKQRESQVLLLLDWDDPKERGVYTGKIFEYLGARRPILATGGSRDDVVAKLLNETQAGIHAPTTEDIKTDLKQFYQEYQAKGEVTFRGNDSEINKYSHREMARKFTEVLDRLT